MSGLTPRKGIGRTPARRGKPQSKGSLAKGRGTVDPVLGSRGIGSRGTSHNGTGNSKYTPRHKAVQKVQQALKALRKKELAKAKVQAASIAQPAAKTSTKPLTSSTSSKPTRQSASSPPSTPAQPSSRKFIQGKAESKLKEKKVDVNDAYTREKLEEIFAANRDPDFPIMKARANSGEMRTLLDYAKAKDVKSVRFLKPGQQKGERTPDIEVTKIDGTKFNVEVRTFVGAPPDVKLKEYYKVGEKAGQRKPQPKNDMSIISLESIGDKIHRGQISEAHPGIIRFHSMKYGITQKSLEGWRDLLKQIGSTRGFPKGLEAIEVTGVPYTVPSSNTTTMNRLRFSSPNWDGELIKDKTW